MIVNLFKGIVVGLAASIPLGPLGVMCIQRTLNKGRSSGFITGMGATVGDTIFASLAILSHAYIQLLLNEYSTIVHIFGGIVVAVIGLRIFISNPIRQLQQKTIEKTYLTDFASAFAMTITNPGALLLVMGLFSYAGIDIGKNAPIPIITTTILGVFIGSIAWWLALSTGINAFRSKFRLKQLLIINRISGIIIILLGLITSVKSIYTFSLPFIKKYIENFNL